MQCGRSRIVLSPELALEIYSQKIQLLWPRSFGSCVDVTKLLRGQSAVVAAKYRVSAKTIRDIWNRRTWTFATSCLWERENTLHKSASSDEVTYISNLDLDFEADIFHNRCRIIVNCVIWAI